MARLPFKPPEYYRLARRSSADSTALLSVSDLDGEDVGLPRRTSPPAAGGLWSWCRGRAGFRLFRRGSAGRNGRRLVALIRLAVGCLVVLIAVTGIFWPSYTHLPPHYQTLRRSAAQSGVSGPGNPHDERIFIAAILYDQEGTLAGGRWGNALLQLIHLLGEDNVFLSIYENDGDVKGHQALRDLESKLPCNSSIHIDPQLDLSAFPRVTAPGGAQRIKRTNYLAELRNRALRPLDEHPEIKYDKVLYLNDVIFDPIDVLHLLFSTNSDHTGVAQYRAACAVDFSNPFKFYDTYATRDLDGYGIGLQFFPWYTTAGTGQSRQDVIAGKDAVRVRSCWGGMVAFDAQYFQRRDNPVRFRADPDVFFDGSESCIIHADIQDPPSTEKQISDTGIYMNPYVRVAYTERTYAWLWLTRRFEKLYSIPHHLASQVAGFPHWNPRRSETPGQVIRETLWVPDATDARGGAFREVDRVAGNDGFCADGFGGYRGLQVIVEDRQPGQGGWEEIPMPST